MAWRRLAFGISGAIIACGLAVLAARGGLPLGFDFTGGTAVVARFAAPVSADALRAAIPGEETVQRFGPLAHNEFLIRLPQAEAVADLEAGVNTIRTALGASGLPQSEIMGSDTMGAALGADFRNKGVLATIASVAGITAYIALRFRPSFAAGAVVATVHDMVVTVSMLAVFGYDLTLNTVAAVLTIAGYSVNDTIVIFDRVRENLRHRGAGSIADAVNLAVNQTLGRTVITAGTTFLAVLALYLFGGDALRGFAFAMLVGITTGTYSTVFIAAPIAAMVARTRRRG
jgi:preprotein translocase subunit SecF